MSNLSITLGLSINNLLSFLATASARSDADGSPTVPNDNVPEPSVTSAFPLLPSDVGNVYAELN